MPQDKRPTAPCQSPPSAAAQRAGAQAALGAAPGAPGTPLRGRVVDRFHAFCVLRRAPFPSLDKPPLHCTRGHAAARAPCTPVSGGGKYPATPSNRRPQPLTQEETRERPAGANARHAPHSCSSNASRLSSACRSFRGSHTTNAPSAPSPQLEQPPSTNWWPRVAWCGCGGGVKARVCGGRSSSVRGATPPSSDGGEVVVVPAQRPLFHAQGNVVLCCVDV